MRKEKWKEDVEKRKREREELRSTRAGNVPGNEKLRCLTS